MPRDIQKDTMEVYSRLIVDLVEEQSKMRIGSPYMIEECLRSSSEKHSWSTSKSKKGAKEGLEIIFGI